VDNLETIAALSALAQPTRLDTFRLLVSREPDGVPAGELARLMEVPQNTMSAHLAPQRPASIPLALKTLEAYGYPVEGFRSKSWAPRRTLQNSISCSPSATARRAKPVRCGRVSR
jgi:ArsR family transcriptional regulator, arsenate/arsenite/antimonite-responsive transcriptional repressor